MSLLRARLVVAAITVGLVVSPAAGVSTALTTSPRPRDVRAGTVIGSVWDTQDHGVAGSLLRLRNVETGKIEATTEADPVGRFTFQGIEGGHYVVEVVNRHGGLIGVGPAFAVVPGETVATFVRLSARRSWFSELGNAAAGTIASAAGLGVTAVSTTGQPVTPQK